MYFVKILSPSLIPTISIFVSIIGTFAVMSMIGFSVNLLTLFALVLAIGTVVDDAIVVVEAVQAKFDEAISLRFSRLMIHERRFVGYPDLYHHLYGSVFPRCHDGRDFGSVLHAVRYHDAVAVGISQSMPSHSHRHFARCC